MQLHDSCDCFQTIKCRLHLNILFISHCWTFVLTCQYLRKYALQLMMSHSLRHCDKSPYSRPTWQNGNIGSGKSHWSCFPVTPVKMQMESENLDDYKWWDFFSNIWILTSLRLVVPQFSNSWSRKNKWVKNVGGFCRTAYFYFCQLKKRNKLCLLLQPSYKWKDVYIPKKDHLSD